MASPKKPRARVLVVDDRIEMAESLADGLAGRGYDAVFDTGPSSALARLEGERVDALVTDLRMPGVDGLTLLERSRELDPSRPVILMTAFGAIDSAVEAMRKGATHYLVKPFKLDELAIVLARALDERRLRREAEVLRRTAPGHAGPARLLGASPAIRDIDALIDRVADADADVLVQGETGTGKGVVAAALHARSTRRDAPFVTVNCAALPETLLESELFGHVRGAFTGAVAARDGLFADAEGGTLFLDEIGEMAPPLQAKLLDVVERRVFRPVGATKERAADVRIVAATHRRLRDAVAAGTFREDLLYRLDVISIEIPPLRERRQDVAVLVEHFLARARQRHPGAPVERIGAAALARLVAYDWPGNVRELGHVIERLVLLGGEAEIPVEALPKTITADGVEQRSTFSGDVISLREVSRRYARWALGRCSGARTKTASLLDVDPKTLAKLLEE